LVRSDGDSARPALYKVQVGTPTVVTRVPVPVRPPSRIVASAVNGCADRLIPSPGQVDRIDRALSSPVSRRPTKADAT
jgi:hypothetical protein